MTATRRGRLRVGTSGYQYDHWKRRFYPAHLPKSEWFAHYVNAFDTVELNRTFYGLPSSEAFDEWRAVAGEHFCFAVKYSRYGTHMKRLKDPERHLSTFLEPVRRLGRTLGPILVQLPPRWSADPARLDEFLTAAPTDLRWAIEVRDPDWLQHSVYDVLRSHGAALVIHDLVDHHPRELTAGWTYLRFHGDAYGGSYSPQRLTAEAERIEGRLERGSDVYVYFNNDREGHAPANAHDLLRYVSSAKARAQESRSVG